MTLPKTLSREKNVLYKQSDGTNPTGYCKEDACNTNGIYKPIEQAPRFSVVQVESRYGTGGVPNSSRFLAYITSPNTYNPKPNYEKKNVVYAQPDE